MCPHPCAMTDNITYLVYAPLVETTILISLRKAIFGLISQSKVPPRASVKPVAYSFSDARQRVNDIVKLRGTGNNSSSPERSLLGHRSPTSLTTADTFRSRSGMDVERGGVDADDDDLESMPRNSGFYREPPRNIFDDL